MVQDYPDGFSRDVPSHTVELEAGFSLPWLQSANLTISAGSNSSFTINFADPNWIYYIDMINVTSQAYSEFYIFVEVNGVVYAAAADMGTIIINLRMNPSILFINGDSVKVTVYNKDSSQRTFAVHINGSKIIRPAVYGHPPSAHWSVNANSCEAYEHLEFTDQSAYNPTAWDWDFGDGTFHATDQNPWHFYMHAGNYNPILVASNQYGWDSYARSTPISVTKNLDFTKFTEYDPDNKISVSPTVIAFSNIDTSHIAYVYKDYLITLFDNYDIEIEFRIESFSNNSHGVYVFGLANGVNALFNVAGIKLVALVYRISSSDHELFFGIMDGTNWVVYQQHAISLSTYYYARIQHVSGSNTITCKVYSDSGYSNLLFTLTVTDNSAKTAFRYLYAFCTDAYGYSVTVSGYVDNYMII